MIVFHASAILETLLRTPAAAAAEGLIFDSGETLDAPHLLDLDVAQVLRRYAMAGQVDSLCCRTALDHLADFR